MSATMKGQIDSAKVVIGEVFWRFWSRISDNQRAWDKDEISELIDDVNYASEHRRTVLPRLDGAAQMLMLACIRDRVADADLKGACREMLYQKENKWKNIPGRNRLVYDIRDNVGDLIERFVKANGWNAKRRRPARQTLGNLPAPGWTSTYNSI